MISFCWEKIKSVSIFFKKQRDLCCSFFLANQPSDRINLANQIDKIPQVRRISLDDKAKVKEISIENDNTGWLKKKLFKKVKLPYLTFAGVGASHLCSPHSALPPPFRLRTRVNIRG